MTNVIKFGKTSTTSTLVIIGANGRGKKAADMAEDMGYANICFLDNLANELDDAEILGYPIVGLPEDFMQWKHKGDFFLAIEDDEERGIWGKKLDEADACVATLVHQCAVLGQNVVLGRGCMVEAGAIIAPSCGIGSYSYIGAGATLDCDVRIETCCKVGAGAHLAEGTHLLPCITVEVGSVVK